MDFESNSLGVVTVKILAEDLFEFKVLAKGLFDFLLRVAHSQPIAEFVERTAYADQFE